MTPQMTKWVRFWTVFAVWLFLDLWSKHWADTTLATPLHPIPVAIDEADAGRTLGEVLTERFGFSAQELPAQLATMQKLGAPLGDKPGDSPFGPAGVAATSRGLWVFWRDDRELSPRRIPLTDQRELARWLSLAVPEADPAKVSAVAQEAAQAKTFETWMPQLFRKIDVEDVGALLSEGRVHPIPYAESAFGPTTTVQKGDTYLVLDHQIPVMGSWWKLVYAENPGAAFGFMKGVSPGLRQSFFMILTVVAFIVIGSIVSRLPAQGWWVASAFAGILAGAAGNFVDRVRYGYVIDFIDMDLGFMHWPTFNVADIAIAVGVIALLLDLFFNKNSLLATKKEKAKPAAA
jgi:signal peptidase II